MNFELELISLDCKNIYDRNSDIFLSMSQKGHVGYYIFMYPGTKK